MRHTRHSSLTSSISVLGLLFLFLLIGCGDAIDFDKDSLFSLEDMARDSDYAGATIDMMEQFRQMIDTAVPHLGANPQAIPFSEAIPEGWQQNNARFEYKEEVTSENPDTVLVGVDSRLTASFYQEFDAFSQTPGVRTLDIVDSTALDSTVTMNLNVIEEEDTTYTDTTYTKEYMKSYLVWVNKFYYRSHQDANTELIRFDFGIPENPNLSPRKLEYMDYDNNSILDPDAPRIVTGDSLAIYYADNYQNISELEGVGNYSSVRVVFYSQGSSEFTRGAGMVNVWYLDMTNISPEPGNPMGEFSFHGTTTITDLENEVVLQVEGNVSLRSNAHGNATLRVNGGKNPDCIRGI